MNRSFFISALVFSILVSVLIPFAVFAAPIFETNSISTGNSFFEPEQSITNPLYFDLSAESAKISSLDVIVKPNATDPTLDEVFITFLDARSTSTVYLAYTNNLITNSTGQPYFVDVFNSTQTVMLSENEIDKAPAFPFTPCNFASSPKIAVTDTHVFVTWLDQEDTVLPCLAPNGPDRIAAVAIAKTSFADISSSAFYSNSSPTPAYFDTGSGSELPVSYSMTANGTKAYITWENSTSVNFIPFDGASFIATTGDFGTDVILDSSTTAENPDVIVESTSPYDIHVVWNDAGAGDTDVKLRKISDNGVTFDPVLNEDPADISKTNSVKSEKVKLAETGGTVYISWLEGLDAKQQLFVASSGNGNSPVAVSTNSGQSTAQQIISAGTNVFAVWQDNVDGGPSYEILFSNSTNSGVDFGTPINLSQSSGDSVLPKISGNSTNVNIVWRDNTFLPLSVADDVDGQVWFKSYNITSATTSGLQVISESTNSTKKTYRAADKDVSVSYPAPIPNISSSSNVVVAVWNPDPARAVDSGEFALTNWEGSMKTAIPSKIDISFNRTEYLSPRNATITVLDSSASTSVNVEMFFPQSGKQTVTLLEGTSGIFSKSLQLYNGSNDDLSTGDVFSANYTTSGSTITTQAKIQDTRILDFLTPSGSTGVVLHDIGGVSGLRLTDSDSDTTGGIDTLNVTITSDIDSDGITLQLNETGATSGIFEATSSLVFMDGAVTPSIGDKMTITQTDETSSDDGDIETITRKVSSTSVPAGFNISLTETGLATDVYTAQLTLCDFSDIACTSPDLGVRDGDFITFSSVGGNEVTNLIVVPDNVLSRGAIEVSCDSSSCGTVTATYNGLDVSINVGDTLASGGGGGGISRAGLVVNALAGISSFGGGADGSAPISSLGILVNNPNFNTPDEIISIVENFDPEIALEPIPKNKFADFDMPLTINDNGYPLSGYDNTITTYSTTVGEPMTITSLYYEQTNLQHVSLYLNLRDDSKGDLSQSDTQILFNKDKPITIVDLNNYFESVSVNIIEGDDLKKFAQFEIVFAKSMEKSDIVLRSWDDKLRSMDTIIYDAIEINEISSTLDESLEPEPTEIMEDTPTSLPQVPIWVKNTVEWWADGKIDDTAFAQGIQFLIQEKILDVPLEPNVSISKDDLVDEIESVDEEQEIEIPQWIQNNAKWWADGLLSEDDFLKGIQYLVENKIIEI